jgi:hypothetical protein
MQTLQQQLSYSSFCNSLWFVSVWLRKAYLQILLLCVIVDDNTAAEKGASTVADTTIAKYTSTEEGRLGRSKRAARPSGRYMGPELQ